MKSKEINALLIQSKIDELRIALEQEMPSTVVSVEITFTGSGTHQYIEHGHPKRLIAKRNLKGEFIH